MVATMAKASSGFGDRLRALRIRAGLTQGELAERAGLHLNGLSKLEYGEREPNWLTVLSLAKALEVEVTAFVTGEEQPPAKQPPPAPDPSGEKLRGRRGKRK